MTPDMSGAIISHSLSSEYIPALLFLAAAAAAALKACAERFVAPNPSSIIYQLVALPVTVPIALLLEPRP